MADYKAARAKTNRNEGGLSFNPNDIGNVIVGGVVKIPTYMGVAPASNLHWPGFDIIADVLCQEPTMPPYGSDAYRKWVKDLNAVFAANTKLQKLVDNFYEVNYWHANRLGEIVSQLVAEWIYDHAVNAGGRGIMWAQLAARVTPDGGVGPKTLSAINGMNAELFLERAADIAGFYRLEKGQKVPSQLQFLPGWLERDGQPAEVIAMVRKAIGDGVLSENEEADIQEVMNA